MPDEEHYVTRDGERVSPLFDTADEAWKWLMNHQGMSVDWAIRYEGYNLVARLIK